VGAGITGHGGDLIIIDDPIKSREEAESAIFRERVFEWFTDDLYTRDEPGAAIIIINTRWHHDDLYGRILWETTQRVRLCLGRLTVCLRWRTLCAGSGVQAGVMR
jgi:hypothetical protein